MKAFLENFAAILGAATVSLLLISVSHEYGYFWEVGSHFQTLLTASDYFSNAVLWLPALVLVLYAYLDWDVVLGMRRYAPVAFSWSGFVWILVVVVLPIIAFFYFPFASPYSFLLPLVIIWLMYGTKILPFAETDSEVLQQLRRALIVLPVVMAVSFGWGINHGQSALKSFDEPYALQMKAGKRLHRTILRTFDKGVLVRDAAENRVEFLKWDDLAQIYRFAPPQRDVPLSCLWLGLNCGPPPPNL